MQVFCNIFLFPADFRGKGCGFILISVVFPCVGVCFASLAMTMTAN